MSSKPRWITGLGGLGLLLCAAAWWLPQFTAPQVPPHLLKHAVLGLAADPPQQVVQSTTGGQAQSTTYELVNVGASEIHFTEITTTCGCSLAEPLSVKRLSPGERVPLSVRATPPPFGSREVAVKVSFASGEETGQLHLGLTLVGRPQGADHIYEIPVFLELESVTSGVLERDFVVRTGESDPAAPLLTGWQSDDPHVTAVILDSTLGDSSPERPRRTYHCRVTCQLAAEHREWQTAILQPELTRALSETRPKVRIPFRLRQPWQASPSLLLSTADPAAPAPLKVIVSAATPEDVASLSALEVVSAPEGVTTSWGAGRDPSERVLEVTFTPSASRDGELVLSAPDLPARLTIPCRQAITTADTGR